MVIIINGPMNSGKTTISKILSQKLPNCARLEVDSLRDFIGWMPIDEAVPMNLENAVCVTNNFLKRDLNVIFDYPLTQQNYDFISNQLMTTGKDIYVFTLSPRLDVAITNRGTRELKERERERIRHHYKIGINKPEFGVLIDNSDLKPEETAEKILEYIKLGKGKIK